MLDGCCMFMNPGPHIRKPDINFLGLCRLCTNFFTAFTSFYKLVQVWKRQDKKSPKSLCQVSWCMCCPPHYLMDAYAPCMFMNPITQLTCRSPSRLPCSPLHDGQDWISRAHLCAFPISRERKWRRTLHVIFSSVLPFISSGIWNRQLKVLRT